MKERLNKDMIAAMKSGDKQLLSVIRMVKAQIQLDEINTKEELNDEEVITIISKQIKMRNDSVTEFKKGNRTDLIDKTEEEINILKKYLPQQLSQDELEQIIEDTIIKVNAKSASEMGILMKELIPLVKGKADMGLVNQIIKNKLN